MSKIDYSKQDRITIRIASPEVIMSWSKGPVKKAETLNYRTLKPEKDGLFCEKIFGPMRDWECNCGKYKGIKFKGITCDRCGVLVTRSSVRRERMGHIDLACPVTHIWFYKAVPSRLAALMQVGLRDLEKLIYYEEYVVIDPGTTPLKKKQFFSEDEYQEAVVKYGGAFKAKIGADAVREMLKELDMVALCKKLRKDLSDANPNGTNFKKLAKTLKIAEDFRASGNSAEWMVLDVLPVIPPDLRPLVPLEGGRFATSDLNDLYRRVINRNNRLKRLLDLGAPEIIVNNEKRMLQEAVDALFDNGRRGRPVTGPGNRPLKSLSDMLKGKQGRFRQNLLGKRVDYSGRSVIVSGPYLKLHQCGLPKLMALELFKPFIMSRLVERKSAQNIKAAKKMVDTMIPEVWDVLEEVIHEHPVLLNRAPTLHRLGIQAFEPLLVEGKAIQVHPLVCHAFNADFEGDQMAVHLPLSAEAQAEARILMLSSNNILSPAHGAPLATPTQDMILGAYYLTYGPEAEDLAKIDRATHEPRPHVFRTAQEAELSFEAGVVKLHDLAEFRPYGRQGGHVLTTIGRIIYNDRIERALAEALGDAFDASKYVFVNQSMKKRDTTRLIEMLVQTYGATTISLVLDAFKDLGFKYATQAGITISKNDVVIPPEKQSIIEKYEKLVGDITGQYDDGLITQEERHEAVVEQWNAATDEVA